MNLRSISGRGLLLLLALLLAAAAGGCRSGGDPTEPGDSGGGPAEEAASPIRWDSETVAQYIIVVASDASDAEREAAVALQAAFAETFGTRPSIQADLILESAGYVEREKEIVVGRTNRSFSPAYSLAEARSGEYCVVKQGAKLLLAGGTDAGTEKAVELFVSRWLSGGDAAVEFRDEDSLICDDGDYALASFQLDGAEVRCFNLSCDVSTPELQLQLGHLTQAVWDSYGYSASPGNLYSHTMLLSTAELHPEYAGALGEHPAVLTAQDGTLALIAQDESALAAGIHAFHQQIRKGADKIVVDDRQVSLVLESQTLSAMTFNLAGDTDFIKRRDAVLDVLSSYLPAVFGIQEGKTQWLTQLEQLEMYAVVGSGTHEAGHTETYNNLYYRTDLFELVDGGSFWLSDTGEEGSKFPESKRVRIATWARLKERSTGREILFVNTHLDNQSAAAREKQLALVRSFIDANGLPCVLMGDFNSKPDSNLYLDIAAEMDDSRVKAAERYASPTFNGYGNSSHILDYLLFTRDAFDIALYRVHTGLYQGSVYPSDHNAVYVEFTLR